jgi:CTP synthase (UTP-ammonia lyase)
MLMKRIVVLGDWNPEYLTHREIDAAIQLFPTHVQARWVGTDSKDTARLREADALWVVPGSPYRDDEAVYAAIEAARTTGQPFLATCGGFQYTVVEFARNVAGIAGAAHEETSPTANELVVTRLSCSLVAQERVVTAIRGTRMFDICGAAPFVGFHWCNYGIAPSYVDRLVKHGLVISATADDAGVEAIELREHPFFLATLFQPQVGSIAGKPLHPVLQAFLQAL